jgi:hypothetical protein
VGPYGKPASMNYQSANIREIGDFWESGESIFLILEKVGKNVKKSTDLSNLGRFQHFWENWGISGNWGKINPTLDIFWWEFGGSDASGGPLSCLLYAGS